MTIYNLYAPKKKKKEEKMNFGNGPIPGYPLFECCRACRVSKHVLAFIKACINGCK